MARLLGPIFILSVQVLGTFLIGCWLLFTPMRAGNKLHDAFIVFPQVGRDDRVKKLVLRFVGGGLIALAAKAVIGFAGAASLF